MALANKASQNQTQSAEYENPDEDENEAGDGFPEASAGVAEEVVTETKAEKAARQAREYAAQQAAEAAAAEKQATPAKTTALAAGSANKGAVVPKLADLNPIKAYENAFPISFNTFPQVQADQGNFKLRDGEKKIGELISIEMLSWQYQWQLSPGDTDNPQSKDFLRYSADGITAENGDNLQEILKLAHEKGFKKAKIVKRILLSGEVLEAGKLTGLLKEKLVLLDLSARSVANFQVYQAEAALKIAKGKAPEGYNPAQMKLHAKAKSASGMSWTEIEFGGLDAQFED